MLVDNCAMQLVLQPTQFDVLLTENMFGDILSDVGGGSGRIDRHAAVGIARATNPDKGLYEPVHGSAPDIAGQNKANPLRRDRHRWPRCSNTVRLMKEADGGERRRRQSAGLRPGHRGLETEGQAGHHRSKSATQSVRQYE